MNPNTTQAPSARPTMAIDPTIMQLTSQYHQKLQQVNQQLSDTYSSPNNSDKEESDKEEEEEEEEEEQEKEEEEEEEEQEQEEEEEDQPYPIRQSKDGQYLYDLPAPPKAIYSCPQRMLTSIKEFACNHGYAIVIRRSDKDQRKIFKCDR